MTSFEVVRRPVDFFGEIEMLVRSKWLVLVVVAAFPVAAAVAQEKTGKPAQEKPAKAEKDAQCITPELGKGLPACPVMGEAVNFACSVQTDDGPVYFCCKECIPKFEKDKAKFADKVKLQREACAKLARVQVKCPIEGKPIDKQSFAEIDGQKVFFCCKDCLAKYKEAPAKYKGALLASYTYQAKCPVSDETIDPASFVDLPDGNRVYYCCMGCDKKFHAELATYAPKLEAQGTVLNVKKIQAASEKGEKPEKAEKAEKAEKPEKTEKH